MIIALTRFPSLFLRLPSNVLFVIRQRNIEIKRLVPLTESYPDECMLPSTVVDLENQVPRRIKTRLDGVVSPSVFHETCSEEIAGAGILEADLAAVLARDDTEATRPDLIGLEPFATLVASGCV